jgi:hypothetical protein
MAFAEVPYGKILNSQALSAITAHHRVAAAGAGQLRTQIKAEESKLKSEINELAAKGQAIDVGGVAALARPRATSPSFEDSMPF